jgi:hypothetical protein
MSDEKNVRHRFTVPVADTRVNEWIETQSNLGFSLRVLIKAFMREYGMQDATCLELGVQVKKKGRPPKSAQIQYGNMENVTMQGSQLDDSEDTDESEQVAQEQETPVQAQVVTQRPVVKPVSNLTEAEKKFQADMSEGKQINMNDLDRII